MNLTTTNRTYEYLFISLCKEVYVTIMLSIAIFIYDFKFLLCSQVGWLKAEDQTILTLHDKVVTHNMRISVTHDNRSTWQLHIRQVKESDRGCYMCQINTNVMKKQIGCIDVHGKCTLFKKKLKIFNKQSRICLLRKFFPRIKCIFPSVGLLLICPIIINFT